ncbi:hypothetical protein GCM10011505_29320 [Tistrella bauzanensis]|uniref:Peptidase M48 domain-containing protein n=2 Tax=Tistrella bauzanensis TaxID=657419 RepID=A0ABQ1IQD3_9PROT|nr:hypothetical protein GCM10011505_29320 [Tistrella bauzanensis]
MAPRIACRITALAAACWLLAGCTEEVKKAVGGAMSDVRAMVTGEPSLARFDGRYIDSDEVTALMPRATAAQPLDFAYAPTPDQISYTSLYGPGQRSRRVQGTLDVEAATSFPDVQTYLQDRVDLLLQGWPAEHRPAVEVVLSASTNSEPSAMPGRRLVVPMGLLLDQARATDPIVTAMLAHELGHILLSHNDGDSNRDRTVASLTTLGDMAAFVGGGRAEAVAGSMVGQRQSSARDGRSVEADEKRLRRPSGIYRQYVDRVIGSTWNQAEELQADLLAQDLLAALPPGGPHAGDMVAMLSGLAVEKQDLEAAAADAAAAQIRQSGTEMAEVGAVDKAATTDMFGDIAMSVGKSVFLFFTDDHPPIEARRELAVDYSQRLASLRGDAAASGGARALLTKKTEDKRPDPLARLLARKDIQREMRLYTRAFGLMPSLSGASDADADVDYRGFLKALGRIDRVRDPFLLTIAGQAHVATGNNRAARQAYERAVAMPQAGLMPFESLARLDLIERRPQAALDRIAEGEARAKYPPRLLPLRIAALRDAEQPFDEPLQRCMSVYLPDIRFICRAAAGENVSEEDLKTEPTVAGDIINSLSAGR